ncbi:phosphoribosylanthranilate isomerase [Liquorilactobacillus satsumensis]|uniref:phosphoribosylanthranilate isomerase n=1 Tax=Liquorilactobacillus satsumensis TaxID=259059 RepID=UPI001E2F2F6E|nr:phosphoribosylanthranilate isomerase [Liquorilactobacillus satsumensis]MCC7666785.1 N-(5'-phosphoribosyl)anthranilate isomerase [Liquorilactobacillus satsumensis]MCP9311984.1 phosphoribosylanthranilate isomerase [Liquorilactobacillus satsumensis]MCP9328542.1 phosphoribosylanthranilate isomerase [Liquorilactobacillus satsumensis]MCP9358283.1 phosphoribosylanthranilate isomerase [Liquorilactobacillus satsumensis]MCP9359117.1 phosphoribosylanthranilate isomerase [Liquorilactobacillus satsumens
MVKVKICGLMNMADIQAVNDAQPDFAGFVFASGRHQIKLVQALALGKRLDRHIKRVGVFVNEPVANILQIYHAGAITVAQLHGTYSETASAILASAGLETIRVFDYQHFDPYFTADYLMLDASHGKGKLVDLRKIPQTERPLVLAGGLTPQNVRVAIDQVQPAVVDVSSGVEIHGQKDAEKIQQFVKNVREVQKL